MFKGRSAGSSEDVQLNFSTETPLITDTTPKKTKITPPAELPSKQIVSSSVSTASSTPIVPADIIPAQPKTYTLQNGTVLDANGNVITSGNNVIDYSNFASIKFSQYANNPSAYNGQKIQFGQIATTFLPKGGSGGDTNYLELMDPVMGVKVMAEIDDSAMYGVLVNKAQLPEYLEIYGTGASSHTFTNNYGVATSIPVVLLSAVDSCGYDYSCTNTLEHLIP